MKKVIMALILVSGSIAPASDKVSVQDILKAARDLSKSCYDIGVKAGNIETTINFLKTSGDTSQEVANAIKFYTNQHEKILKDAAQSCNLK